MELTEKNGYAELFEVDNFFLGTFRMENVKLYNLGRGNFTFVFNNQLHSPIGFSLGNIKRVEQNFEAGNNFMRFVVNPGFASSLRELVPEGETYNFLSSNKMERLCEMRFPVDLSDIAQVRLQNLFSSVDPIVTDKATNESDVLGEVKFVKKIRVQEQKNKKEEASEDAPQRKKLAKQQNQKQGGPSRDVSRYPNRNLRSRRILFDEENYDGDDEMIPPQLQEQGNKEANIVPDAFPEFNNTDPLLSYHGINIDMEDYKTLDRSGLLTDSILDFWLCYMQNELMTEEQRRSVFIYSSQFYYLYARPANYHGWKESKLTAVEKRYNRIRGWPSHGNSDLFHRDFLLFPCHDKEHWFLGIICHPLLNGSVTMDGGVPVEGVETTHNKKDPSSGVPIKSSSILIFDSVDTNPSRKTTAMKHILNYMKSYYLEHHQQDFPFDAKSIVKKFVKCPQQQNVVDCGVFLLEFAERFLITSPITDYRIPIMKQDWFDPSIIPEKRRNIANAIQKLMEENPLPEWNGVLPALPPIVFYEEPDNNNDSKYENNNKVEGPEAMDTKKVIIVDSQGSAKDSISPLRWYEESKSVHQQLSSSLIAHFPDSPDTENRFEIDSDPDVEMME